MKTESISSKEFIDEQVKISKKRGSKYRNVKTVVDGITFDSKKEANRYQELREILRTGNIRMFAVNPPYPLEVNGVIVCKYIADFCYEERRGRKWIKVIEDVKSEITRKNPVYRIKKKLMKAIYGIDIVEI